MAPSCVRLCGVTSVLVLLAASAAGAALPTPRLLQVQAVCRHGGRAPRASYPTDPYANLTWEAGLAGLVPSGVGEQVRLGAFLRRSYGALLLSGSCSGLHVISSDRNRTQESARALLYGLFRGTPMGGEEYEGGVLPVDEPLCPVNVIPEDEDFILRLISPRRCPRLIAGMADFLRKTSEYTSHVPALKRAFAAHAGMPDASSIDLVEVFDVLRTQRLLGLRLPAWTQQPLTDGGPSIYAALERFFFLAFGSQGAPSLRRLSAGGLLRTMVNAAQPGGPRAVVYAAHDTTLAALEAALGAYDGPLPTSSCLLLEVFGTGDGERFVQLLRRRGSSGELHQLDLSCGRWLCPLSAIEKLPWLPAGVEDVKRGCQL